MNNNDPRPTPATPTADAINAAIRARYEGLTFTPNDRPADRSKNGTRIPRSVRHRGLR